MKKITTAFLCAVFFCASSFSFAGTGDKNLSLPKNKPFKLVRLSAANAPFPTYDIAYFYNNTTITMYLVYATSTTNYTFVPGSYNINISGTIQYLGGSPMNYPDPSFYGNSSYVSFSNGVCTVNFNGDPYISSFSISSASIPPGETLPYGNLPVMAQLGDPY